MYNTLVALCRSNRLLRVGAFAQLLVVWFAELVASLPVLALGCSVDSSGWLVVIIANRLRYMLTAICSLRSVVVVGHHHSIAMMM